MYRLLIVDDEASIRNGIAESVPWAEWGFTVAGLCANGMEALEAAKELQPHVVLSDIRMPKMDGIALMQELNAQFPSIKIVILSGYSDFEYLKVSIRNRVVDYLLKPTNLDDFQKLFINLKQQLDVEQARYEDQRRLLEEYEKSREQRHANWLESFVRGFAAGSDAPVYKQELEEAYGLCFENCFVAALSFDERLSEQLNQRYLQWIALQNACNAAAMPGERFFVTREETLVGIMSLPEDRELTSQAVGARVRAVQQAAQQNAGFSVSAGISGLCTELAMLPLCYEQAKCCVQQSQFSGTGQLAFYSQFENADVAKTDYLDVELMEKALLANDYPAVEREIRALFAGFENRLLKDSGQVDRIALEALFSLSRWALKYNIDMSALWASLGARHTDIFLCNTLDMKRDFVLAVFFAVQQEFLKGKRKPANSVASLVRECIDTEFGNNAVSLEYVADKVKKSPVYISRVFKHEFGCNFSEYLTKKRMAEAEALLADPALKVYEIAQRVGYADPSNFIKVFRRHKGISPNEFRADRQRGEWKSNG